MTKNLILITGAAGFIGYHTARKLLEEGVPVLGLDNLNAYYDPALKQARLDRLKTYPAFQFVLADITQAKALMSLFETHRPEVVIHLAAQVGVRNSIDAPQSYMDANMTGFFNILEACRAYPVKHLLYASSSSVYGNLDAALSPENQTDRPLSLYAATKKANELMAHAYSVGFKIPTTGMRFFTVYGPMGRPDMAYYSFAKAILNDQSITLYHQGAMKRDFTYVEDVAKVIVSLIDKIPGEESLGNPVPYRVLNVGGGVPVDLITFVGILEKKLGMQAVIKYEKADPSEAIITCADVSGLDQLLGYHPTTSLEEGLGQFIDWMKSSSDLFKGR